MAQLQEQAEPDSPVEALESLIWSLSSGDILKAEDIMDRLTLVKAVQWSLIMEANHVRE